MRLSTKSRLFDRVRRRAGHRLGPRRTHRRVGDGRRRVSRERLRRRPGHEHPAARRERPDQRDGPAAGSNCSAPGPPDSQDQLGKYANLLYGAPSLTDATLGNYFDDESFGVQAGRHHPHREPGRRRRRSTATPTTSRTSTATTDADDGLRGGLRAGRGPAVPHGRAAPLRRGHAGVVPRRFVRVRADGPRRTAARAVHPGTGAGPGRRPAERVRRAGREEPSR